MCYWLWASFSAAHFLGHGFGLIPAPGSFAGSAFPAPPNNHHCDLNHRLAIPEASFGRFGAYKSCKSEVQVNAFSEL